MISYSLSSFQFRNIISAVYGRHFAIHKEAPRRLFCWLSLLWRKGFCLCRNWGNKCRQAPTVCHPNWRLDWDILQKKNLHRHLFQKKQKDLLFIVKKYFKSHALLSLRCRIYTVDKADLSNPQAASEAPRRTKASTNNIITAMSELGVVER